MFPEFLVAISLAFFSTVVTIGLLIKAAPALGLLDHPGGRKQHESSTPVVGGLGMFAGLAVSWLMVPEVRPSLTVLCGFVFFVVLGAIDDRVHLRAGPKFLFQGFVSAAVVVGSGVSLTSLGQVIPGWWVDLGWLAIPFSAFAIVSVINAINMSDGVDGLAGSLCLVAMVALGGAAWLAGSGQLTAFALVCCAGLIGFLIYNLRTSAGRPARVFMGDAGSLGLGFLVALLALKLASAERSVGVPPAVVIWVCFVPLADGLSVILTRLSRRSGAMRPGRDHLHHLLLSRGLSPGGVVAAEAGIGLTVALLAILGWQAGLPDWVLVAAFAAAFVVFHLMVSRAWLEQASRASQSAAKVSPNPTAATEGVVAAEQAGS